MIQPAVFTTALALAFAAVLAFVVFSGRLSPNGRKGVERVLRALVLAMAVPLYGWVLVSMIREGDWLWFSVQPILWVWVAVTVIRERRQKARAQSRQPGTFD